MVVWQQTNDIIRLSTSNQAGVIFPEVLQGGADVNYGATAPSEEQNEVAEKRWGRGEERGAQIEGRNISPFERESLLMVWETLVGPLVGGEGCQQSLKKRNIVSYGDGKTRGGRRKVSNLF